MFAQEPVVGVDNPETLFHDKDPKLDRNKQTRVSHYAGPAGMQSLE